MIININIYYKYKKELTKIFINMNKIDRNNDFNLGF